MLAGSLVGSWLGTFSVTSFVSLLPGSSPQAIRSLFSIQAFPSSGHSPQGSSPDGGGPAPYPLLREAFLSLPGHSPPPSWSQHLPLPPSSVPHSVVHLESLPRPPGPNPPLFPALSKGLGLVWTHVKACGTNELINLLGGETRAEPKKDEEGLCGNPLRLGQHLSCLAPRGGEGGL